MSQRHNVTTCDYYRYRLQVRPGNFEVVHRSGQHEYGVVAKLEENRLNYLRQNQHVCQRLQHCLHGDGLARLACRRRGRFVDSAVGSIQPILLDSPALYILEIAGQQ